jgi:hypothetical protein
VGDARHEFRREVFGDPYLVWHDGADIDALIAEHERRAERAERMVRAGVGEHDHVDRADRLRTRPNRARPLHPRTQGGCARRC